VYYCNACDEPVLIRHVGGAARCPACDHVDPTIAIRPLFVVTGASGSGRARDVGAQIEFGRWLRKNLSPVVDTTSRSPSEVADTVAAWARDRTAV